MSHQQTPTPFASPNTSASFGPSSGSDNQALEMAKGWISTLQSQISTLQSQISTLQFQNNTLHTLNNTLQSQNDALKEENQNLKNRSSFSSASVAVQHQSTSSFPHQSTSSSPLPNTPSSSSFSQAPPTSYLPQSTPPSFPPQASLASTQQFSAADKEELLFADQEEEIKRRIAAMPNKSGGDPNRKSRSMRASEYLAVASRGYEFFPLGPGLPNNKRRYESALRDGGNFLKEHPDCSRSQFNQEIVKAYPEFGLCDDLWKAEAFQSACRTRARKILNPSSTQSEGSASGA